MSKISAINLGKVFSGCAVPCSPEAIALLTSEDFIKRKDDPFCYRFVKSSNLIATGEWEGDSVEIPLTDLQVCNLYSSDQLKSEQQTLAYQAAFWALRKSRLARELNKIATYETYQALWTEYGGELVNQAFLELSEEEKARINALKPKPKIEFSVGDRVFYAGQKCQIDKLGVVGKYRGKAKVTISPNFEEKWIDLTELEPVNNQQPTIKPCFSSSTNSLAESGDSVRPLNLRADSVSETTLTKTPTPSLSTDIITQGLPFTETSEVTIQTKEPTSTQLDFPAPARPPLAVEPGLLTPNPVFGLKPCDALSRGVQNSWLLKILKDSSTEVFDQCLADSEWQTIRTTIRSSYRRHGSVIPTNETECSLLPTPTTYSKGSGNCRPAGQTKLELTLRPHFLKGEKLNPQTMGWMMGFRPGYVEDVLMPVSSAIQLPLTPEFLTTSQSAALPAISTVEQSCPNKQRSHSVESFISTLSYKQCQESTENLITVPDVVEEGRSDAVAAAEETIEPTEKQQIELNAFASKFSATYASIAGIPQVEASKSSGEVAGTSGNDKFNQLGEEIDQIEKSRIFEVNQEPVSKPRHLAPIVPNDQETDLSILDAEQQHLKTQIAKFKSDRKKTASLKQWKNQLEKIQALRAIVEGGQLLVGLWVSKERSDFNCVGQIIEINRQSVWVRWWGNPTPYPEHLGDLIWDEFAQSTALEPDDKISILPGHKVFPVGAVFQVQDLQVNGWVLTTDGHLISSKYWEIANAKIQPQQTNENNHEVFGFPQDIPAIETTGSPQEAVSEDCTRGSNLPEKGQVQLPNQIVQSSDLAYRQFLQMGIPPAQARYLAKQA